jgi:hypothetical protein
MLGWAGRASIVCLIIKVLRCRTQLNAAAFARDLESLFAETSGSFNYHIGS